jgi:hypothetical protein
MIVKAEAAHARGFLVVNALLFITIAIEVAAIVEPAPGAAARQCVAGGKPMTSAHHVRSLIRGRSKPLLNAGRCTVARGGHPHWPMGRGARPTQPDT